MATLQDKAVRYLASHVEEILAKQNDRGEFWPDAGFRAEYNTDYQQFAYYPLAYLFTLKHPENPWFENPRLLAAAVRSFQNNLSILKDDGAFIGTSHDAAPHAWPNNWRSFTWLRSWELLRGHIGRELATACEQGLRKAFGAVEKHAHREIVEKGFGVGHNIRNHPIWHILTTLCLARTFGGDAAAKWAVEQLERVCAAQHPCGLWYEHDGPVIVYNHVSMSGISHYHALTGSAAARAALDRALEYYRVATYPSGHPIETLDGRVRYTGYTLSMHPATWAHSPDGCSHLHFILDKLLAEPFGPGYQTHGSWLGLPFFTQFTRDLPVETPVPANVAPLAGDGVHEIPQLPVRVIRRGPWTITASAFTRPEAPTNRWILDFQAHLSVHHAKTGLIIGGGGGKRQAALSLFTGGSRPLGLPCLAVDGSAETTGPASARITLNYPTFSATLDVAVDGDAALITARAARKAGAEPGPVFLQLPMPMKGAPRIITEKNAWVEMDLQHELPPGEIGQWYGREGLYRVSGIDGARALIHVLPYNTHWRDGRAPAEKAMSVIALPLAEGEARQIRVTPL